MLSQASGELSMDIPIPSVVKVWRGGCIIRSALLDVFKNVYEGGDYKNILLDKNIAQLLQS